MLRRGARGASEEAAGAQHPLLVPPDAATGVV